MLKEIFAIKVVNKTAAAAQLGNCILLHAYSRRIIAATSCANTIKNITYLIVRSGIAVFLVIN